MSIKGTIDEVIKTPMDRREFLLHMGVGLLTLVGVTGFLKALSGNRPGGKTAQQNGYGSSPYGGGTRSGRL